MTTKREAPATPECDRIAERGHDLDAVREFIEFAEEKGIFLTDCRRPHSLGAALAPNAVESLIMAWIGVDMKARERELRALLAHMRAPEHDNDDE